MRKRYVKILGQALLFCLLWIAASLSVLAAGVVTVKLDGTESYKMANEVLELVNQERAKAGSAPLVMDKQLQEAAMQRSHEQPILFSHTRPDGSSCFTAIADMGTTAGENIALGQSSAAAVMSSWMDSRGHRENILSSSYTTIGIGCFQHNGRYYWVQLFTDNTTEPVTQTHQRNITGVVAVSQDNLQLSLQTNQTGAMKEGGKRSYQVKHLNKGTQIAAAILNPGSFVWSSNNSTAATVSNGTVTGVGGGTARITAKVGNTEMVTDVTVEHLWNQAYQVVVPPTCIGKGVEESVCKGCGAKRTREVKARGHRYSAWVTTRPATCFAEGIRSRSCSGCNATQTQTIAKLKAKVTLNAVRMKLQVRKSTTALKIKSMTAGDAVSKWKSSKPSVAKVHARTGKVTAKRPGTAYIILEMKSGASARCRIQVQKGVVKTTSLRSSKKSYTLRKGKKVQLNITVNPITSSQKVTYKSENKRVATVSKKGKVTARRKGQTKIVVKSGKKILKIRIKVK